MTEAICPNLLQGRSAVIVGAGGGGIGTAVATLIAQSGAQTIVADIDEARAESVAEEVRKDGYEATAAQVNALDSGSVDSLIATAVSTYGGLDILINVVGGMTAFLAWSETADSSDADFDFLYQLNLRSAFFGCRAAIRQFVKQGRGGAIVNTSSISGYQSAPGHAAYGAAKAGVMSLTRTLAVEYGPQNIRVNNIAPGLISTTPTASAAMVAQMGPDVGKRSDIGAVQGDPQRGGISETIPLGQSGIPLGRRGIPLDVARVALFLASDLSGYVSGQTLLVDGGASVNWDFYP
jgi:3-oxoacyl-[acyl-carrier protein] reductase